MKVTEIEESENDLHGGHGGHGTVGAASKIFRSPINELSKFNAGAAKSGAKYWMIIDFEVSEVDQERSRLDAIVGSFVMEPTNQPWDNRF